jgi:AcrR family transcriptional regulator
MGIAARRERRRTELRERILGAARDIVMREGFAALTMRKIAEAIEYAPATIYLHFDSRDAIARELCVQGFRELLGYIRPVAGIADPLDRLEAIAAAYVRFGMEHPETYRLIFMADPKYTTAVFRGDPRAEREGPGAQALRELVGTLETLKARRGLAAEVDCRQLADVVWAALHGIVSLKLTCPVFPATPLEALVPAMIRSLTEGLPGLAHARVTAS